MKAKFEKLENSEAKLIVSLEKDEFEKYHDKALKSIQEAVVIDGFRKGNAPENLIVEKYGEMMILEEMAHLAINGSFYETVINENKDKKDDEKIVPISEPKISITKIGKGSEFEYSAHFATLPKINLPEYKKISKDEKAKVEAELLEELKKNNADAKAEQIFDVQDEEVVEILENLRKARNVGAHVHDDGTVHDHAHGDQTEGEIKSDSPSLPELNDEFAQSFGDNFKTLEDLKNKVKENLSLEKKAKIQDKERNHILERLVKETFASIPEILIEEELIRMKSQMNADVERIGGKWDEYLTQIKKTEDDLKLEWRDTANKRVLSQLILNEIAKAEKIEVSKEEIDVEAIRILTDMPEANENHVNSYVHQMLINEKVMKLLSV